MWIINEEQNKKNIMIEHLIVKFIFKELKIERYSANNLFYRIRLIK